MRPYGDCITTGGTGQQPQAALWEGLEVGEGRHETPREVVEQPTHTVRGHSVRFRSWLGGRLHHVRWYRPFRQSGGASRQIQR